MLSGCSRATSLVVLTVVAVGQVVAGRLRFAARQQAFAAQLHAAQGGAVDFADAAVQLLRVGFLQGQFCLADDATSEVRSWWVASLRKRFSVSTCSILL